MSYKTSVQSLFLPFIVTALFGTLSESTNATDRASSLATVKAPAGQYSSQLTPRFERQAVESRLQLDIDSNLALLKAQSDFKLWAEIFKSEASRAASVKTKEMTAVQVADILCGAMPGRPPEFPTVYSPKCGLQPGVDAFVALDMEKVVRYEKAMSVWQNLPSRGLFVEFLLSDILVFAAGRKSLEQVAVKNGGFLFDDNLLDSYFGAKLRGTSTYRLASKTVAIPNAIEILDGRATNGGLLEELVKLSFQVGTSIPVDRSAFGDSIGSYSFPLVMLFLNYAANSGFEDKDPFFSKKLVGSLVGGFTPVSWAAWVELFAFPEANSPRNIEYWHEVMPFQVSGLAYCKRYLDSDFRPTASVQTMSAANQTMSAAKCTLSEFDAGDSYNDSVISFEGVLGAIASARESEYVGFTGIELKSTSSVSIDECSKPNCTSSSLSFEMNLLEPMVPMILSVELIIDRDGKPETYVKELSVSPGLNSFKFVNSVDMFSFERTIRGVKQGSFYQLGDDRVSEIRFFFKRSLNSPRDIRPINVSFTIDKESISRAIRIQE